jgi:hypothetical protein
VGKRARGRRGGAGPRKGGDPAPAGIERQDLIDEVAGRARAGGRHGSRRYHRATSNSKSW